MTRRNFFLAKIAGAVTAKLAARAAQVDRPQTLPRAKWIQNGLIDAGGSHEPYTFVVRRGGQSLDAYQTYQRAQSEELIRALKESGVEVFHTHFYKGAGMAHEKAEMEDAKRVAALAHLGRTGVDEQSGMILGHRGGQLAVLHAAVRTQTVHDACILGTEGRIHVHPPMWHPTRLTLAVYGKEERLIELPYEGNGYNYEAAEVGRCLRQGRVGSEVMSLDETLAIMRTMDRIRAQWGLVYPCERAKPAPGRKRPAGKLAARRADRRRRR